MSIPASVILGGDLDTLGRLRSGRLDFPFMPTKTRPYVEGQVIQIPGVIGHYDLPYIVPHDMELASIALAASEYHPIDCWSVFIGEDKPENYVLRTIYTKDLPEGFQLMAMIPLKEGDKLTMRFHNYGGKAKHVWINYQGLVDQVKEFDNSVEGLPNDTGTEGGV